MSSQTRTALVAGVLFVITFVASLPALAVTAKPPHTRALLFHGGKAELAQISTVMNRIVRHAQIGRGSHLTASCGHAQPAINAHGLGYRYIVCAFTAPRSLDFHGTLTFSIVPPRTVVYHGEVCASFPDDCAPMHGSWNAGPPPPRSGL